MSLPEPEQIGICTNAIGEVYRSGKIRSGKIRKGESIYNGDKISTDRNAFLSLLNIQDKSVINLYGNSVIKIFGSVEKDSIKTEINIFGGRVSAELRKTRNRISYEGFFVEYDYLKRKKADILNLIKNLKIKIEKEINW